MNTNRLPRNVAIACMFAGALVAANCNRETPASTTPPAPAPAVVAQPAAAPARPVVSKVVLVMSFASPSLEAKARTVLNSGANVDLAVRGFQTPQQFLSVAYAAKNLDIPFALLKDKVVSQRMTLARAISTSSRYSVNATLEAARAESEARADLGRKTGPQ